MGVYLSQPETTKITESKENKQYKYTSCEMQGWRKNMEDAKIHELEVKVDAKTYAIFGVFDGHGGPEVSKFVENHFIQQLTKNSEFKKGNVAEGLSETFRKMDELMLAENGKNQLQNLRRQRGGDQDTYDSELVSDGTGCTANVLVIDQSNYYVANCGDSRSVLCRNGKVVVLSQDHKPESKIQRDRIEFAGGEITNGRVNGGLNLTRALGDFDYKKTKDLDYKRQMITCHPDVITVSRSAQDQYIILGCDGIWQKYVTNSQGMVDVLCRQINSFKSSTQIMQDLLDNLLAKSTMQEMGCDNMTSILIQIKQHE